MSTDAWTNGSVTVTRLAGPESEGADRVRWEVLVNDGQSWATSRLRRHEALALAAAIVVSVADVTVRP